MRLNANDDKDQITQQKIRRYFFRDEFDVTAFANMPLSLLPRLMTAKNRFSVIYRMLKCIPDLRNVTVRRDEQLNEMGYQFGQLEFAN